MDIIDEGMKYRHNRYNRYRYKLQTIVIIDIGIKHRHNRYKYKIQT